MSDVSLTGQNKNTARIKRKKTSPFSKSKMFDTGPVCTPVKKGQQFAPVLK